MTPSIPPQKTGNSFLVEGFLKHLLGRDPFHVDLAMASQQIRQTVILVTGAAGSIGSEICGELLRHEPDTLLCLDYDQPALARLERDLAESTGKTRVIYLTADICDPASIERAFAEHHPVTIFHSAASKHIPPMEHDVHQAVRNNIFGLLNVLTVAARECRNFVFISSDKAVNPRSVVGVTKRIGELIISRYPSKKMRALSVRLGNVLGSSGSVLPILQQQLRNNEPLTITDPAATRFFLSPSEAAAFILAAFAIGQPGDILIPDMGTPVRIADLAQRLIRVSGPPGQNAQLMFTGLRPGEKLSEELSFRHEHPEPTSVPRLSRVRNPPSGWSDLASKLSELHTALKHEESTAVRRRLQQIVPEYL